jgi:ribonuclease BN (tRNA processing enzyme)
LIFAYAMFDNPPSGARTSLTSMPAVESPDHGQLEQVGGVAAAANAKHVILSHYSPTDLPDSQSLDAI